MSFTSIDITVRPIKIATLVDFNDKKSLKTAISINSILWGGIYNPIIPVYKRLPQNFTDAISYKFLNHKEITKGYLSAFDADYIINLSAAKADSLGIEAWRLIKESDIFDNSSHTIRSGVIGEIHYGVSLFEILDYVEEQEFKYQRSVPLPVFDIQIPKRNELFLSSVFGAYSPKTRDAFNKRYESTIGIRPKAVNISNFLGALSDGDLTVRRLCNTYFDCFNSGARDAIIFLLDPNSWQDIVDYINLKALGLSVLPVPIQICMTQQVNSLTVDFVDKNYAKYRKPRIPQSTTLLKSRNCSEVQLRQFSESLKISQKNGEFKLSVQNWQPRIWDDWARDRDGVGGCSLEHRRVSREIQDTNEVRLDCERPDFLDESHSQWKPKYVNELSINTYGAEDFMANVFPLNIERPDMVVGWPDPDGWRFSKAGIVYLPSHRHDKINLKIPTAEKVYSEWQRSLKINAQTSTPGKLARQLVRKMGVDRLNLLAVEEFAKLIQRLTNAKGQTLSISHDRLFAEIQKFSKNTIWIDAEGFFRWILAKRIFELGADIECESCGRKSWYSLEDIRGTVRCTVCLEPIKIGLSNPKKQIIWSYRLVAPFTVPDLAQGAYTVVLVLNFFSDLMKMKITPRYSFESKDGAYEADFGALVKQGWQDGGDIINLLGECKSFGYKSRPQFKDNDVAKLIRLGKKSGKSVLVFATLNRNLTDGDKKRLIKLVYRLRESRFKQDASIDLMILTGNELFCQHALKESWEKLGGKHAKFIKNKYRLSIRELCDMTQQLYLGVDDWWTWADHKRKALDTKMN